MITAYYDANYLFKLQCKEHGTADVQAHAATVQVLYTALHARAEFTSAAFRKVREGTAMGSPLNEKEREAHENQVTVTLAEPFWMSCTEVTHRQWKAVTRRDPKRVPKVTGPSFPVEGLYWADANAFIEVLNVTSPVNGWKCALPTEAQWKYAFRAGTETPFGLGSSLNSNQANVSGIFPYGTSVEGPRSLNRSCEVQSYKPNAWGLYDMHGNVAEWCLDLWDGQSRLREGRDSKGRAGNNVVRGGFYFGFAQLCRSASRSHCPPDGIPLATGFRPVLVPKK
jgi:formylglycine-generating enzyme required for sulfatase activity